MNKKMSSFILNLKVGDRFYDELNGRYLNVDRIDQPSRTVLCTEMEDSDEDDDTCEFIVTESSIFTFTELSHFRKL